MFDERGDPTDLSRLVVPLVGSLEATSVPFQPYRLLDAAGAAVPAADAYFAELAACGRPATTQRSYGMDLLRWFRFLAARDVNWDQATRGEGRDFCRWLALAPKQPRPHWRRQGSASPLAHKQPAPNPRTGKRAPGPYYAPVTVAHAESASADHRWLAKTRPSWRTTISLRLGTLLRTVPAPHRTHGLVLYRLHAWLHHGSDDRRRRLPLRASSEIGQTWVPSRMVARG